MFEVGWSELLLIGGVALIVIGPKELPTVLRTVGRTVTKVRRMAGEFQSQFQDALREADVADIRKDITTAAKTVRDAVPTKELFDPVRGIRDEIRATVAGAGAAVSSIPAALEAGAQPAATPEAASSTAEDDPAAAMREAIRASLAGTASAGAVATGVQAFASEGAAPSSSISDVPTAGDVQQDDPLHDLLPPPPSSSSFEVQPLPPPFPVSLEPEPEAVPASSAGAGADEAGGLVAPSSSRTS